MFELGFSEIIVIGVVALIVVGPERLPKVARTIGHLLGRAQRYVADVKSDIQREMQLEELQKLQEQVKQQARELETTVRAGVASVDKELGATAAEVRQQLGERAPAPVQPGPSALPGQPSAAPEAGSAPEHEARR